MKLTGWFPGDVAPVRRGLYQRQMAVPPVKRWAWWNGTYWMVGHELAARAMCEKRCSLHQFAPYLQWRGVLR